MMEHYARKDIGITSVRTVAIILGLLCTTYMISYAKPNKVDSLSARMVKVESLVETEQRERAILQKEVEFCEKSLRNIDEHVDRANVEISNQIAASSHTIQAWGWIIAIITILVSIVGIWYAYYINKMRKDITHLLSEAQDQLNQADEASDGIAEQQQRLSAQQSDIRKTLADTEEKIKELQQLYHDIQGNAREIYENVKREETKALLTRLENVPEDVSTLHGLLLVRPLEEEDFEIILRAYNGLITLNLDIYGITSVEELRKRSQQFINKEEAFMLLFAQHFMGKAIVVPALRSRLQLMFESLFRNYFFKNDAEKSTRDLKAGVATLEVGLQSEIIADYILAMSTSRYAKYMEWYKVLLVDMAEKQLEEIWDSVTMRHKKAISFAKSIKEIVADLNPQSPLLEKIAAYIAKGSERVKE